MQSFPHSDEYVHFIAELRELREQLGITQEVVATRLDIDRTLVTKSERGIRRLDVIELRAWLAALGTDLPAFVARLEARLARNTKLTSKPRIKPARGAP